jgi:cell wall assembly regulator SMI1/ankyrin repeat protein
MAKSPKWDADCVRAVVNGDLDALRSALALGLPVNKHVYGTDTLTPLHYAVDSEAKPAVVSALLAAGADVNVRTTGDSAGGKTPLMLAAYRGRADLVELLLAAGADPHLVAPTGVSALAEAGWGGKTAAYERVMDALLAAGARPDAEALVAAARYGSPGMVRKLVAAGAQVSEMSRWGTALHLAVDEGRADTTEALLAAGADPSFRLPAGFRNYPGKTALDLAREKRRAKLVALLESGGPPPAERATKPAGLAAVWERLTKALGRAAPLVKKSLRKGTTDARLNALEAALGVTLPPDVRASYLLHDGQKDGADGLLPEGFAGLDAEYVLLPVACIPAEWRPWQELHAGGEFAGQVGKPDAGVRADWWHPGWVPVASNGAGDAVCIDLAPAKGGSVGQVVWVGHESGDRPRLAGSLGELLAALAEHYEELAAE